MTKPTNVSALEEARTGTTRIIQELSGEWWQAFEPEVAGILGNLFHRLATGIKEASKTRDGTGTVKPVLEKLSAWAEEKAATSSSGPWHPMPEVATIRMSPSSCRIPYSDERGIVGDILRFGADVSVLEPKELRQKVQQAGLAMVSRYV